MQPLLAQTRDLRVRLAEGAIPAGADPADLIELVGELEALKSAACAAQAGAAVRLDRERRRERAEAGVPAAQQGIGVAAELALARKESPHRGQILLGFAKVLDAELPHTRTRLAAGDLTEWRAMIVARETACLEVEQRASVDRRLCADPATLAGLGTGQLVSRVRALAAQIDPAAVARRSSRAESERCVSLRPAPDTMTYLTALLPVAHGVAAYAALRQEADRRRGMGDPRSRGQLLADLLVSRLTGLAMSEPTTGSADSPGLPASVPPPAVPVMVNLTMSDAALLAGDHRPAELGAEGVPPQVIPAEVARLLVSGALHSEVETWIRTLYADPTGRLVALTSRARFHPEGLAAYLNQRDRGICRTPYCDAPIRHHDHIIDHDRGGQTSATNGQGLCEACNHAKQGHGWTQRPLDDGPRHAVETVTPTGYRYLSHAPPPIGFDAAA